MITIIGMGPGPPEDLTRRAWRSLNGARKVFLRTARHPCAARLPQTIDRVSFDEVYQSRERFADVYAEITDRVLQAAVEEGEAVYAVPGDPAVGESTVARIRQRALEAGIAVEIIPGLSFIEPCLAQIGFDALDGIQIIDALSVAEQAHPPLNPALPALLAQVYSRAVASDLKLTLMNQYPDDAPAILIHAAGNAHASVERLPLYQIDRSSRIDVMTTLYLPALDDLSSFETLQNLIARLRSPEGCPWDREQTHHSLRPFLVEETHEVLEALDAGDAAALCEELGDLLLQIMLHTQIAIDEGEFMMSDLLRTLSQKLIRRHPHVWGEVDAGGDPALAARSWDEIKAEEKSGKAEARGSLLDGVPKGAPALFVAHRYSARAAKVGFDWDDISGIEAKAAEEYAEILAATSDHERALEIGDMIFVLVNWLRWLGVDDPESLARATNAKFYRRFRHVETRAEQAGKTCSDVGLDQLETWWREAKRLHG